MGERATIRIKQTYSNIPIHLYTHWRGAEIDSIFDEGLRRIVEAGRETDESYATRIMFDTLTNGDDSALSFGIIIGDNRPGDVSYDTPCLEWMDNSPWVYRIPWNDSFGSTRPLRLSTYLSLRNHPTVAKEHNNA